MENIPVDCVYAESVATIAVVAKYGDDWLRLATYPIAKVSDDCKGDGLKTLPANCIPEKYCLELCPHRVPREGREDNNE